MDEHFRTAPFAHNMPVLLGLLTVWYANFFGTQTIAILPYDQYLERFPAYLQQLTMESNGKRVTDAGEAVGYGTAPILWGEPGTNGQHSFHQLLHQGTRVVPADFIGFTAPRHELGRHHDLLLANLIAQAQALAFGRDAPGEPHRVCPGDRPSTTILVDGPLTPAALGKLVALYEHRVLVEGVLWGIDSFDQWGVELGKVLAGTIAAELEATAAPGPGAHDSSTTELLRRARVARGRAT
jgi:glucose-6-phosphate isomerase